MIDLAILGVLKEQDLHGYELKKRLRELLGPLSSVSFGSLYPALARLERAGAVQAVDASVATARVPIPMTGSLTGEAAAFRAARRRVTRGRRGKKVYGITEQGERRLAELLAEPGDDDRTFALRLAFCRHLDGTGRLALFQGRRAQLVERLREVRRAPGAERDDRYVRSLREHDEDRTESDIAWLDRLIAAEQAASPDIDGAAAAAGTADTDPRTTGGDNP